MLLLLLQVLDMASKLPEDMPQKWKQTVLLQAAESAANVFRLQNPQQQHFGSSAVAAAEPAAAQMASPAAAGSKTATPAPDAATGAAAVDVDPSPAATSSAGQQQDGDVLPGLLAAAQNHPQLRSMPPDKREALLKQLLHQHQAKRLSQQGSMLDPSRAGSLGAAGGTDWAVFGQQSQQGGPGATTSLGMSPGLAGAGGADLLWQMAGMSGSSGQKQQQQLGRGCQTPHSATLSRFGSLPWDLQQPGSGMGTTTDPAFQAALGGAGGAGGFSDMFADAAGGLGGAAGGGSSSNDGSNIFSGLMGGIGPEMRAQYMKKLQAQLELHGMNKKQLVENIKAKGALAALKSIGMLPSDLGAGAAAGAGTGAAADGGSSQAAGAAGTAGAAAAAGGMDPAMAAAMPSDAAFAAMRQQVLQQQLSLGPSQQAWLQHQNQQAAAAAAGLGCSGMTDGSMSALLAQQQQWHGMMGMQQQGMAGGYPNLLGPSLYGMDGLGPSTGAESLSGVGGMQLDPLGGLLRGSAQQQAMLMQQQQHHHHAMAFSSGMVGPYQHPHGSLGMLAAQQQLMYHQHKLAGMGSGMGSAAVTAGMPWGCMGMGGLQQPAVGSSAALDPPVLELPNLSPIKTGAAAAMAGPASAGAAAGGSASAAATAPSAPAAAPGAPGVASAAAAADAPARRSSQAGAPARSIGSAGQQQQQQLQPLELPGSLAELGGPEDDAIAMSPFGQLGLNAADVDALLSGFEPSGLMGLMAQGDEPGNSNSLKGMGELWSTTRTSG